MKKIFSILFIIAILLPMFEVWSCGPVSNCSEMQWGYSYGEFDHYNVDAKYITPGGTHYDPSGLQISPELIDRLTSEASDCLVKSTFKVGCDGAKISAIDKSSIVVKIPNDAVLSCDKSEELLPTPVLSGGAGCVAKGLNPTDSCPCRWRAGVKCPNIIIVTPSMYLYKDALLRFVTGCGDPWSIPELAVCATPSTLPLSDGTDPKNGL